MTTVEIMLPNGEAKTFTGHHARWSGDGNILFLYPGESEDTLTSMLETGVQSFSLLAIPVMTISTA